MSEQQPTFNQRVNYGKQWHRWGCGPVRELSRNQSNVVTIVPEYMFEQYNSPYYFTYEVDAKELHEIA
jgi:hypothetical protein